MSTTQTAEMKVARQDLNPCTIQIEVVCTKAQVDSGFDRALKAFAKRVKVPGFRPGSAPKAMVEQMVGERDLAGAALEDIVNSALRKAMEQESVRADAAPSVNVTKFDRAAGECEFTAKVPLAPKVTLGDYKGLGASRPPVSVTDEEVERQVDELRSRSGKREAVTGRGIQPGDAAVVNIRIQDGDAEGRNFMTVAGQTFPDLDAAIVGMAAEEIKHADLSFPANFQEADWAGKSFACTVTIRSVSAIQAPDLDDDFAQSFNAENVDDLRAKVREGVVNAKAQVGQEMVNEQLLDQLLRTSEVHVSDNTWEAVGQRRLQENQAELQRQGSDLEKYAQANGMTLQELVDAQMQEARLHVQRTVLIEHIFRAEDMKIKQSDVDAIFLQIARENGVKQEDLAKFAKEYGPQIREEVVFRAMYGQVMAYLNEHATVTEGEAPAKPKAKAAAKPSGDKPAAKAKPAAKKKS